MQESNDAAGQEASSVALNLKDQTRAQASLRVTKQQARALLQLLSLICTLSAVAAGG